jgi:hypothetical protein
MCYAGLHNAFITPKNPLDFRTANISGKCPAEGVPQDVDSHTGDQGLEIQAKAVKICRGCPAAPYKHFEPAL